MAKKQLIDFVNRLKKSGIKISLTKPRSESLLTLGQNHKLPTTTLTR